MTQIKSAEVAAPTDKSNDKSMKQFLVMWSGQAVSLFGSRLVRFAVVWWITLQTGSATILATVSMAFMLPQILAGPLAGSYVDRWNRKRIMIAADFLIALVTAVFAFLYFVDAIRIWHIYVLMLSASLLSSFHWPAMQASTSMLVPEEHLSRVGGMNQSLQGLASILAPPLGALLFALVPMESILGIDIVTALIAILTVAAIHIPQPNRKKEDKGSPFEDMIEGFRFIRNWTGALILIIFAMVLNLVTTPAFSLLPLLATNHFSGGASTLALLQSVNAGGMLAGGAILGFWGGSERKVNTAMAALVIEGIAVLFIGMTPPSAVLFAAVLMLVIGLMMPIFNGSIVAILQATIPKEKQGRVLSLISSGASAMTPIGLGIAGPVSDLIGVPSWYVIAGAVTASLSIGAFFIPAVMNLEERMKQEAGETEKEDEAKLAEDKL